MWDQTYLAVESSDCEARPERENDIVDDEESSSEMRMIYTPTNIIQVDTTYTNGGQTLGKFCIDSPRLAVGRRGQSWHPGAAGYY
jgi:hypothetical protein